MTTWFPGQPYTVPLAGDRLKNGYAMDVTCPTRRQRGPFSSVPSIQGGRAVLVWLLFVSSACSGSSGDGNVGGAHPKDANNVDGAAVDSALEVGASLDFATIPRDTPAVAIDGSVLADAAADRAVDAALTRPDGGQGAFVHPGCLSTQKDLDRMKSKVAAAAQPWKGSWDKLTANAHAQLAYTPNPQVSICAGGDCAPENYMTLAHDAAAAYQLALRSQVAGDPAYAAKATQILDAWATTLTGVTGDSNAGLRAALYGYQLAAAGELVRGDARWNPAALQTLLTKVFYPIQSDFLNNHNGACERNYWANWDLANLASVLAIGVFANRRDIFDEGIRYFHEGGGEGSIGNAIHYVHPDGSGQWQESGRDQGHSTLGPMLMAVVCEIAWNQGIDLYGAAGNRFLLGSEYVAAYNLGNEVPFVTYQYWSGPEGSCKAGVQSVVSTSGRGSQRPGWELIYNHFVHRAGRSAPYTQHYAAANRPEGGGGDYGSTSGGFDSLGFSTLTHTLDPIATGAVPGNLRPFVQGRRIALSWDGSAYATGYLVKRATTTGGPYTTLATVTTGQSHVDSGLTTGTTYYYVVSALHANGESANSKEAAAKADEQVLGTAIGTVGSFGALGAVKELAFDGSLKNYFDGPDQVSWVGLDLGEGAAALPTGVRYAPRAHYAERMVGGKFQGSTTADFSRDIVDLFTIAIAPPEGTLTEQAVVATRSFRYLRYLAPTGAYGNVAEVQFLGKL